MTVSCCIGLGGLHSRFNLIQRHAMLGFFRRVLCANNRSLRRDSTSVETVCASDNAVLLVPGSPVETDENTSEGASWRRNGAQRPVPCTTTISSTGLP